VCCVDLVNSWKHVGVFPRSQVGHLGALSELGTFHFLESAFSDPVMHIPDLQETARLRTRLNYSVAKMNRRWCSRERASPYLKVVWFLFFRRLLNRNLPSAVPQERGKHRRYAATRLTAKLLSPTTFIIGYRATKVSLLRVAFRAFESIRVHGTCRCDRMSADWHKIWRVKLLKTRGNPPQGGKKKNEEDPLTVSAPENDERRKFFEGVTPLGQ